MRRTAIRAAMLAILASGSLLSTQLSALAQETDLPQEAASGATITSNVAATGVSMDWSSLSSDRVLIVGVDNRVFGYPSDTLHSWTRQAHSFSSPAR